VNRSGQPCSRSRTITLPRIGTHTPWPLSLTTSYFRTPQFWAGRYRDEA